MLSTVDKFLKFTAPKYIVLKGLTAISKKSSINWNETTTSTYTYLK